MVTRKRTLGAGGNKTGDGTVSYMTKAQKGVYFMDKLSFISTIKPLLKERGYGKSGNYWYKYTNEIVFCINVQGSQWDKDDYYTEIGIAFPSTECKNPTIMHWYCRHRCKGSNGELNISPNELISIVDRVFSTIEGTKDVDTFLHESRASRVGLQFWF